MNSDLNPIVEQDISPMALSREPKSVVLVDDDLYLCDLVRLILNHYHWPITIFQVADDAISYLQTHKPDFIILDLMLPKVDGLQAFAKIRATLPNLPSKFIATTAYHSYDTEQVVMKHGFDGLLTKPFEATKLTDYLSSFLD